MNIRAILPVPRYLSADAILQIVGNMHGIPLVPVKGVFWHQAMEAGFLQASQDGVEWILSVDSDSMFVESDIELMQKELAADSSINALVPIQRYRGQEGPMLQVHSETEQSGHLGLTFLRASCLRDLEPPWFEAQPGYDGHWGDGKQDADIAFWRKWTRAGNGLHVSEASIGHLVEKVVGYDGDMNPYCFDPEEWRQWRKGTHGI